MTDNGLRVRFAPSPTGYLHVGGVRTTLFNWLFAKKNKATFVLRIEDTDKIRSTKEAIDDILNSLKWLGLDWDEGPYYQSERLDLYKQHADILIEKGFAYKSTHVKQPVAGERTEGPTGEAIYLKALKEMISIDDIVHGKIEFDTNLIEDFVIIKSDGMPTYNFACVVDDALMKISHIIRGDDHISNTPRQIMIYKLLGFPIPKFAHVPMILGPDGGRLSKRHGATSVGEYEKQGFLAPALLNFLVLLGWSPGDDREVMTIKEMIEAFDLSRITGKSAVFNQEKLTWMNGMYIAQLPDKELVALCAPYIKFAGFNCSNEKLEKIVPLFKKRIKLLPEIVSITEYFFKDDIEYDQKAVDKFIKPEKSKLILKRVKEVISSLKNLGLKEQEDALRPLVEELQVKPKELMQTMRVALTGRTASAGIFETIEAMGKDMVLKRLDVAEKL